MIININGLLWIVIHIHSFYSIWFHLLRPMRDFLVGLSLLGLGFGRWSSCRVYFKISQKEGKKDTENAAHYLGLRRIFFSPSREIMMILRCHYRLLLACSLNCSPSISSNATGQRPTTNQQKKVNVHCAHANAKYNQIEGLVFFFYFSGKIPLRTIFSPFVFWILKTHILVSVSYKNYLLRFDWAERKYISNVRDQRAFNSAFRKKNQN